jgi:integrase
MSPESMAQSLAMLRQVLDGISYVEIARQAGVSRTLVEQRVKTIARELAARMGVAGIAPHGPVLAAQLRHERGAYLEAIARFRPQDLPDAPPRSAALSDADIEHLVSVTRAHSNCRARDVALLYMLFATGAKPLEVARLEVGDYLAKDGTVRVESILRAQAAISGTARPLYFANPKLVSAIDQYLAQRVPAGQGAGRPGEYRGLAPDSKLFLSADGEPMTIHAEDHGGSRHHKCRSVLEIYRRIFRRAGLPGVSALSARRTVARRLAERGCDIEQAGQVLGITPRAVRHLLTTAPQPMRKLFSELL